MTRIAIVSVHYYGDYLARSTAAISRLAAATSADTVVAVANRRDLVPALSAAASALGARSAECLEHDNNGLEFGAYQTGLDRVIASEPDWVVFANDTFGIHNCFYSIYRKRLLAALSIPASATLQVAGEVVSIPRSYTIGGARTNRWLTTSIFALNRSALRALQGRIFYPEVDELIRASAEREVFFSDALDDALVEHLAAWLFGVPGQGSWYGAAPLTASSAARLARKARSILQEKHLSARLDHAGAWFIDLNPYGAREKISRRLEQALFEASARFTGPRRNVKSLPLRRTAPR